MKHKELRIERKELNMREEEQEVKNFISINRKSYFSLQ